MSLKMPIRHTLGVHRAPDGNISIKACQDIKMMLNRRRFYAEEHKNRDKGTTFAA